MINRFGAGGIPHMPSKLKNNAQERVQTTVTAKAKSKRVRKKLRSDPSKPPKFGEYLLYFFLSKPNRINLLGDLEEEFGEVYKKFGRWPAKLFYYKNVACSFAPLIWRRLAKWGTIAWIGDWLRRHI